MIVGSDTNACFEIAIYSHMYVFTEGLDTFSAFKWYLEHKKEVLDSFVVNTNLSVEV